MMEDKPEQKNTLPIELLREGDKLLFRNRRWAFLLVPVFGMIPLAAWYQAGAAVGDASVLFLALGLLMIFGGVLMGLWAREWVLDLSDRRYTLLSGPVFMRKVQTGSFDDMTIALSNRKSHQSSPASQTHHDRGTGLVWVIEFGTKEGERFLYWECGDEESTRQEARRWSEETRCKLCDESKWSIVDGVIQSRHQHD